MSLFNLWLHKTKRNLRLIVTTRRSATPAANTSPVTHCPTKPFEEQKLSPDSHFQKLGKPGKRSYGTIVVRLSPSFWSTEDEQLKPKPVCVNNVVQSSDEVLDSDTKPKVPSIGRRRKLEHEIIAENENFLPIFKRRLFFLKEDQHPLSFGKEPISPKKTVSHKESFENSRGIPTCSLTTERSNVGESGQFLPLSTCINHEGGVSSHTTASICRSLKDSTSTAEVQTLTNTLSAEGQLINKYPISLRCNQQINTRTLLNESCKPQPSSNYQSSSLFINYLPGRGLSANTVVETVPLNSEERPKPVAVFSQPVVDKAPKVVKNTKNKFDSKNPSANTSPFYTKRAKYPETKTTANALENTKDPTVAVASFNKVNTETSETTKSPSFDEESPVLKFFRLKQIDAARETEAITATEIQNAEVFEETSKSLVTSSSTEFELQNLEGLKKLGLNSERSSTAEAFNLNCAQEDNSLITPPVAESYGIENIASSISVAISPVSHLQSSLSTPSQSFETASRIPSTAIASRSFTTGAAITSIVNNSRNITTPKKPIIAARRFPLVRTPEVRSNPLRRMAVDERSSPAQFVKEEYFEKLNAEDSPACTNWDPHLLIDKLYEISYNPRIESKINRFTNMEGHLEVPVNENDIIAELQKKWVKKYFRTKEGRLQWFATHFADDSPVGEVLLSGCDIEAKKDEGLLIVHGGKANVRMILKVPLPNNVFDKWRKALNSHAGSSYMDAFMQPITPIIPLSTQRVIIIELGLCSIRAGVLTKEPSLPQCFFPSIAVKKDDGSIVVGRAALAPENRHNGEIVRPIQPTDPAFERFILHIEVLKACIQKCIDHLHVDPTKYMILLTIPQSVPTVLIGDILKILLEGFDFQGAAISTHPSLILHAYDVTTGVVVDIGDRLNIIPVVDGYVVENAIVSLPYGALQIANALQTKLAETNMSPYNFKSPVERLLLRYVMEQSCYTAVSFDEEVKRYTENPSDIDMIVSLDDFQPLTEMTSTFKVNSARFTATEGLFKPKRWNLDTKGLHELVHEAIQLSPIDSRKVLSRNIYLAGGTSLLPGLAERLEAEISSLVAPTIFTQVHVSPWRYHAAYLGAQAIASSVQFEDKCITRETLQSFIVKLQKSTF